MKFNFTNLISQSVPNLAPPGEHIKPIYDFGVAYPDPESIPIPELIHSFSTALEEEGQNLALYPHPDGYPPLRDFVSKKLSTERNINITPEQIILTNGSSESIHMISEILINPLDSVLTEKYVYSGTLRTLKRFNANVFGIECDQSGIIPFELEKKIKTLNQQNQTVKLLYTIPTFQNPLGHSMSTKRREEILEITQKYNIAILEDDCYVDLNYENINYPSIYSLDKSESVIYVGSFSKIIAPGMRMGYVVSPKAIIDKLRIVKSGGGVNQLAALTIHRYSNTKLNEDIKRRNKILKDKRNAMAQALEQYFDFDSQTKWNIPDGGLYIWLEMSSKYDLVKLLPKANQANINYHPGTAFDPEGKIGKNCARLCFGYNSSKEIKKGIELLSRLIKNN